MRQTVFCGEAQYILMECTVISKECSTSITSYQKTGGMRDKTWRNRHQFPLKRCYSSTKLYGVISKSISVLVLGNVCNGVHFLLGRMVSHGSWAHAKRACASKDKFGVPCRCALKRTWRALPTTRCSSILENAVRAALKVSESLHQTKGFKYQWY